jgi:hypothetical protein
MDMMSIFIVVVVTARILRPRQMTAATRTMDMMSIFIVVVVTARILRPRKLTAATRIDVIDFVTINNLVYVASIDILFVFLS